MQKYFILGICSRALILSISFLTYFVTSPYDKSTSLVEEKTVFRNLLRWDAVHFLEISKHGYTSDHLTVFFPLLPMIVKFISRFTGVSNFTIAVLFNNLLFVISVPLFKIVSANLIVNTKQRAFVSTVSTLLYAFNPSSIVFSSMYSEGLFAVVSMVFFFQLLFTRKKEVIISAGILGLIRSNFIMFIPLMLKRCGIEILFSFIPFALFQQYILFKHYLNTCDFTVFIPYKYFQGKYWNQGFLRFYCYNNILNFFFGLPIVYIAIIVLRLNKPNVVKIPGLYYLLAVQVYLLVFMIHMNMASRFISSNPFFYIGISRIYLLHPKLFYRIIKLYLCYTFVYSVLFSAFFPPA